MKRMVSILVWAVISAAFIGPGTVTTAAAAGAGFGLQLLWAVLFSTLATLILQEASARITIVSDFTLGQALRQRFSGGIGSILVLLLILGAIVLGCAAYEAGNILGGVAGAALGTGFSSSGLTLAVGVSAALLLWFGNIRYISYVLGAVVAFMGLAFLITAISLEPDASLLMRRTFWPALPRGSGVLVLGLIGTTVVPYNLFLGSGLARGQNLPEMRFGLTLSILLGGLITMGVLVVGTAVRGDFSFQALAGVLQSKLGVWAELLFAVGLFCAGFSSAVTAPLAAAVTAASLFGGAGNPSWHEKSRRFRAVWIGVLLVGVFFGLSGIRPVPAIILAQALNGIVLPLAAVFLLLMVNDRKVMGDEGCNGIFANVLSFAVALTTIVLGVMNILKAVTATLGTAAPAEQTILRLSILCGVVILGPVWYSIVQSVRRSREKTSR